MLLVPDSTNNSAGSSKQKKRGGMTQEEDLMLDDLEDMLANDNRKSDDARTNTSNYGGAIVTGALTGQNKSHAPGIDFKGRERGDTQEN